MRGAAVQRGLNRIWPPSIARRVTLLLVVGITVGSCFLTLSDWILPALKAKAPRGRDTHKRWTKLLPELRKRYLPQNGRGDVSLQVEVWHSSLQPHLLYLDEWLLRRCVSLPWLI